MPEKFISLRCPDCFSANVFFHDGGYLCRNCGKRLSLRNGILRALPMDLSEKSSANLGYYDARSAVKESELARRAISRNHHIKLRKVLETLRLEKAPPSLEVIEFGMGYGSHGAAIQGAGHHYTGLDVSIGNLEQALQRYPNLVHSCLVEGDALRTPFPDAFFDAAFCVATLHHLPHPEDGIREMVRVLKKGGRFCVLEPRRYYPTQFLQWLQHPQTEVSAMKMNGPTAQKWLRESGVKKTQVSPCIFTPNGPQPFIPFYEFLDSAFRKVPFFHPLSVMFCVYGEK